MIPERLIDEAILSEWMADETDNVEHKVRLRMQANRLRQMADEVAQLPVYVPATVIPLHRPRLVAVRGEAVA